MSSYAIKSARFSALLKQQKNLGKAVTRDFKPAGATEVRSAAASFIEMRDRIQRQIEQRTTMLAGVSHDLRTPLTRLKLQLAMLPESNEIEELNTDIVEMEDMLDDYLAFARGYQGETASRKPSWLRSWSTFTMMPNAALAKCSGTLSRPLINTGRDQAKCDAPLHHQSGQ